MTIDSISGKSASAAYFGGQTVQSFISQNLGPDSGNDIWSYMAEQQAARVTLCFDQIGEKVIHDLAGVTAEYLADRPELSEEYALVVIGGPSGDGREVRAYRREDLVAGLDGDEKEKALKELDQSPLLYRTSAEGLPDQPDDPALTGLADTVQVFLDKNGKLLNILEREGYMTWGA